MDCRLDPLAALGLEAGDAHVIRNAGGIVTEDVRRSLALSQALLGTRSVRIVQHTDCGLHGLDDQEILARLEHDHGVRPGWRPGGFAVLERSVRESIDAIVADPHIDGSDVRGYVIDVLSGGLRAVQPEDDPNG